MAISTPYQPPKDRLERYKDFVSQNSENDVYSPEKGLEALLSGLTPDTKFPVLCSMESANIYFSSSELADSIRKWLKFNGLSKGMFPLKSISGVWAYCQKNKGGEIIDGSLVDIGAVVKHSFYYTSEGLKTGYQISQAGTELYMPLGTCAVDFAWKARNSSIAHKYDSMVRLLGSVNSPAERKRQVVIYKVVRFLVDNPYYHRHKDISVNLRLAEGDVSGALITLGNAGVIEYTPYVRESEGERVRGIVTYRMGPNASMGFDQIYLKIRTIRIDFRRGGQIQKVFEFIRAHPEFEYEANNLAELLQIKLDKVQGCLSSMADIGFLQRLAASRIVRSKVRANDLTMMLHNEVMQPAWYTAVTLTPIAKRAMNTEKLMTFLQNYREERFNIGRAGGEEVRAIALGLLSNLGEMKLSHIVQEGNKILSRQVGPSAYTRQLYHLMERGLVVKTRKSHFALVKIN